MRLEIELIVNFQAQSNTIYFGMWRRVVLCVQLVYKINRTWKWKEKFMEKMCNLANCIRWLLCVAHVHNLTHTHTQTHTMNVCKNVNMLHSKWEMEKFSYIHVCVCVRTEICQRHAYMHARIHLLIHSFVDSFRSFIYLYLKYQLNFDKWKQNMRQADMSLKVCHRVRFHFSCVSFLFWVCVWECGAALLLFQCESIDAYGCQ